MPDRPPPIARVRLARSIPRLVAAPIVIALAGLAALGAAYLVGGVPGIGLAVAGGLVVVLALAGLVVLLTVRLDVEEAAIRVRWMGGERVYVLVQGPVTRVALRGPNASSLRPSFGGLGWAFGRARLRDEERIDVVLLSRARTAILVPTQRGRLAIAAASESDLLGALSRAARARQRLHDRAWQGPPVQAPAQAPPV
ncbi:MAG: hypothetical protein ACRDGV_12110, partial [Candidatus Limnocylindria bacterium]